MKKERVVSNEIFFLFNRRWWWCPLLKYLLVQSNKNEVLSLMIEWRSCSQFHKHFTDNLTVFLRLLGPSNVKAARRTLMKSTPIPVVNSPTFYEHILRQYSFSREKLRKSTFIWKSCFQNVGGIDTWRKECDFKLAQAREQYLKKRQSLYRVYHRFCPNHISKNLFA